MCKPQCFWHVTKRLTNQDQESRIKTIVVYQQYIFNNTTPTIVNLHESAQSVLISLNDLKKYSVTIQ